MTTIALQELIGRADTGKVSFATHRGTVTKTNMWSESRVTGGGGSSVSIAGWGGGSTRAVSTKVTNHREFWLKGASGKDSHFVTDANRVKVMEEQDVSVLTMSKGKKSAVVLVRNHAQDETQHNKMDLAVAFETKPWPFIVAGVCGIIWFGMFLAGASNLFSLMMFIGMAVGGYFAFKQYKFVQQRIAEYVAAMAAG